MFNVFLNPNIRERMLEVAYMTDPSPKEGLPSWDEISSMPGDYAVRMFLDLDDLYYRFKEAFQVIVNEAIAELSGSGKYVNVTFLPNLSFLNRLFTIKSPSYGHGSDEVFTNYIEGTQNFAKVYSSNVDDIEAYGALLDDSPAAASLDNTVNSIYMGSTFMALAYSIYEAAVVPKTPEDVTKAYSFWYQDPKDDIPDYEKDYEDVINYWQHTHQQVKAVFKQAALSKV